MGQLQYTALPIGEGSFLGIAPLKLFNHIPQVETLRKKVTVSE